MILDISNLQVPLEQFLNELVEHGFVVGEHDTENKTVTVFRPVSLKQFFQINFHMIKVTLKEKLSLIKYKIVRFFDSLIKKIKRKSHITKGKITTGLKRKFTKKFIPKVKQLFAGLKNKILRRSDEGVMSEHNELTTTETKG